MAKDKSKDKNKNKKSSSSVKVKSAESVVANPRLVAAIKSYTLSLEQTKSYLVDVATICQEEQLTRSEVVASLMEARGIEKSSAESQYSRMKQILTDPDELERFRTGEATLKEIRESTKGTQKNPSKEQKAKNAEKKRTAAIKVLINVAKEMGDDLATLINTIKAAAKKAGIK